MWLVSVLIGRDIYRDAAQELSELASSCGYDVLVHTEAKIDRPYHMKFLGWVKFEEIQE